MSDISVFIGGKAGDGIDKASFIIARILSRLGYNIFLDRDYPSIIRGGHTFSIIRASDKKISARFDGVDFFLALNQDCVDLQGSRIRDNAFVIYDSNSVKTAGFGIPLADIIKEENAPVIMRNSCITGAFCKTAGIDWQILEGIFKKEVKREVDLNLKIARRGYDAAETKARTAIVSKDVLPLFTGNEAIGLGLVRGGLNAYIAYPMTPSSALLHFLAENAERFSLKVIHPESEIAVMLMALGASYAGEKAAVGTSGGGFCLMTEGLSFSGMAELPVVVILGQRTGPSTGLPTYTGQTELNFALGAGQGEFTRFVAAPGDAEEAYYWSAVSMNLSWKYQVPSIILTDKNVAEGTYSFDAGSVKGLKEESPVFRDTDEPYKRYRDSETGVSPLAFPAEKGAVVKINSYEHGETGLTTEDPVIVKKMQEKRLRKEEFLLKELEEKYETVRVYGKKDSATALLCWGSNKGVCVEAGESLGLKVIHQAVFSPFSSRQFAEAVRGVKKLVCVENNSTSQLSQLINRYGFAVNEKVLKYDGRPFTVEELENLIKEMIK